MIEDSLIVAPRDEWISFCDRDKFDLVAIYDDTSETPGPSDAPLSRLERAIYETAFRKIKSVPVLLVGGLDAWKREFGEREIVLTNKVTIYPYLRRSHELKCCPTIATAAASPNAAPPSQVFPSPTLKTFRAVPPAPRITPLV